MAGPQMPDGGVKTPVEAGIIARAMAGLKGAKDAFSNAWFGPLEPLKPIVPGQLQASVTGRQFDFPVGFNKQITPRSTEATSFGQLRALAENCDVMRIVIETRKDQMAKMKWAIKPSDENKKKDTRCEELTKFFKSPDKEHDWDTWLRMLMDDLLVIDAPALYIRRTNGNSVYALEPMDGGTIKRVLDDHGRTPIAPLPAYQQILKGIPAIDYDTTELIYRPRNPRTYKVYGYSPVEQVLMTVNIALRRAVHKLQYYTEGNVPEAIMGVPENWNVTQVEAFQVYWDSLHEGNTAERRHMKFVPGGLKMQATKEDVLKDAFDEWLARIVCFAFSIEPTPFVHQTNRATAESAREAALAEGLAPLMQWVQNLINFVIQIHFGYTDLCFDWVDEEVQDPLEKAQVDKIYLDAKVVTPDEIRKDLGKEALTEEQQTLLNPPPSPQLLAPPGPDGGVAVPNDGKTPVAVPKNAPQAPSKATASKPAVQSGKEAVEKSKKAVRGTPINRDRPRMQKLDRKLSKVISKFLKTQAPVIAKQLTGLVGKIEKAGKDPLADLNLDWDSLVEDVSVVLAAVTKDGSAEAFASIGKTGDVDGPATAWANDRAAELVGKKWVDGKLVDNPNAKWVITDSTRDMLNNYVSQAIDDGMTTDELSQYLEDSFAFSEGRADMIARTEVAMADSTSQMIAYQDSGVVAGTVWITANDDAVSDGCQANAEAGVVPLGELYPSGDEAPPAHPNCRCDIVAELSPEEES